MKKKIILLSVLIILIGLLVAGIIFINKAEGSADSINPNLVLLRLSESDISRIKTENAYGEHTASFYTDNTSVQRLKLDIYKDLPAHNGTCQNLLNNVVALNAKRNFGVTSKDDEYYGFNDPYSVLTVILNDGSEKKVIFGGLSPDKSGRYTRLVGNKNIFLVDSAVADIFAQNPENFLSLNLFGVYTDEEAMSVKKIILGGSCRDTEIVAENIKSEYSARIFRISSPKQSYANDENLAEFCAMLTLNYSADGLEVLDPSDDELKKYGLDKPYSTVKFVFEGKEEYIEFGKTDDGLFACVNHLPAVYRLNADDYSFIGFDLQSLSSSALFSCIVKYIDSVTVTSESGKAVMNVANETVSINGRSMEYSAFKKYYSALLESLSKSSLKTPSKNLKELCKVEICFNYDRSAESFVYYEDNGEYYVSANGGELLMLDHEKTEKFISFGKQAGVTR